jgi:hypothetical protein
VSRRQSALLLGIARQTLRLNLRNLGLSSRAPSGPKRATRSGARALDRVWPPDSAFSLDGTIGLFRLNFTLGRTDKTRRT